MIVVVAAGADQSCGTTPARGASRHGHLRVQRAAEAVEVDASARALRQFQLDVAAEGLGVDGTARPRDLDVPGEGMKALVAGHVRDFDVTGENFDIELDILRHLDVELGIDDVVVVALIQLSSRLLASMTTPEEVSRTSSLM